MRLCCPREILDTSSWLPTGPFVSHESPDATFMSTVTIPAGTLVKIAGFPFRLQEDAVATGEEANLKAGLELLATDADPTPDRINLQAAFESGIEASHCPGEPEAPAPVAK